MLRSVAVTTSDLSLTLGRDPWYPLGPLQAGMLYDALRFGGDAGYDIEQVHLVLAETVDSGLLGRAFQWVTRQHTALQTEFRWDENGVPQQRVAPHAILPIQVENWARVPVRDRDALLRSFLQADRKHGFDMRQAPLARVKILVMGDERTEVIWTVHHVLVDASSFPLVLLDVFSAYECLCRGLQPTGGGFVPQYRSYIDWLATLDLTLSRAYFARLLANAPSAPMLPGVALAANRLPPSPNRVVRRMGADLLGRARACAERTHTSVETLVHAAWALVLARYCGATGDLVFGATRAGRRSARVVGIENMVGLVANTLPIRARLGEAQAVAGLLQDLRAQSLALREHEHTPLFEIEHPDRHTHRTHFHTTVTYQKWDLEQQLAKRGGAAWEHRSCTVHEQPVPPLNAKIVESDQLELSLVFDGTRLDRRVVERIADSFVFVLGEMDSNLRTTPNDVAVMPPETVHQILVEWNDTAHAFPEDLLIHEAFEACADSRPDAVAVEAGAVRLTYRELEVSANRLAHTLRARGLGPGRFVAICLRRSADLIVAMLAVAKAGASYVPLDPRHPESRLAFMLRDSRSECVLTDSSLSHLFKGAVRLLVSEDPGVASAPTDRLERLTSSRDVCYAIYTSGTTGDPNGVLLSHRAVVNTLDWVNRAFAVGPGDRSLFVTSPCFDLSVYDVFGVLGAGATIVIANDAQVLDPIRLLDILDHAGVTVWNSAPATLASALASARNGATNGCLRLVLLSGDWIPLALPDAVRARYPGARVVSLGGATEAAIWSNWFPVEQIEPDWTSIPYGTPIQNCRYHVLDSAMRPVPVGVAGDLYIGGACLAEGYLGRPKLTRERFVDDPFSPGARLYRSGDRALYHHDGQLRLLGRQDSQVKIRGNRVELGEVEAALLKLPGVKQGIAVAYLDASGQKAVGAYVVLDKKSKLDARKIREELTGILASFAVPSRVALLEALPISPNGKVDRKALPRLDELAGTGTFVPPRTPVERKMAALWEELLDKRPIGVTDDFFALGGHSLLAVTLMSRIRSQFGWDVPLEQLLARPTIEALVDTNGASSTPDALGHFLVFNPLGTKIPIVLVPGIYGTLFVFRQLPKRFGPDQPVYLAKDFSSCCPGDTRAPTVERMAAACEAELLTLCKNGRVILGGLSFGMLVAFELAERVRKKGIDVPLLISLDGMAPGYPEFLPRFERLTAHVREFATGDRKRYLSDRAANTRRRFLRLLGREHELCAEVLSASSEVRRLMKRTFNVNARASRCYRPQFTFPGEMLLFRAERPERWVGIRRLDPLHGWTDFVNGRISVVVLPGDHGTILDEANQNAVVTSVDQHLRALTMRASTKAQTDGAKTESTVTFRAPTAS